MNRSLGFRSFALGLALALVPVLGACKKPAERSAVTTTASSAPSLVTTAPAASAALGVLPAGEVVRGASIYELKSPFVDQNDKAARLDVHHGHPTLIAMFYATCPYACPRLIANVKKIEAALPPETRADLRVLLITIDPENDTPAALRGVIQRYGLDAARWTLFTGKEDDVRDAAAVLGIQYREADGTINHSSVITLLDREGHIDTRYDGLTDAHVDAAKRIGEVAALRPSH